MTTQLAQAMSGQFVAPDELRTLMRNHLKGVAVITAGGVRPVGFCATSLVSVCLAPPTLAFTVNRAASSWPVIRESGYALVHLLDENQTALAQRFSVPGGDRFGTDTAWSRGPFGLPRLEGVLGRAVLEMVSRAEFGTHALVIGRVVEIEDDSQGGRPLGHHAGQFVGVDSFI